MQHIPCRRRAPVPSASPAPATPHTATMDAQQEDETACQAPVAATFAERAADRFKHLFDWMMG